MQTDSQTEVTCNLQNLVAVTSAEHQRSPAQEHQSGCLQRTRKARHVRRKGSFRGETADWLLRMPYLQVVNRPSGVVATQSFRMSRRNVLLHSKTASSVYCGICTRTSVPKGLQDRQQAVYGRFQGEDRTFATSSRRLLPMTVAGSVRWSEGTCRPKPVQTRQSRQRSLPLVGEYGLLAMGSAKTSSATKCRCMAAALAVNRF